MLPYQKENKWYIIGSLLLVCIYCASLQVLPGFVADIDYWEKWGSYSKEHGLTNIYYSDTNYYPLYHYILWPFAELFDTREALHAHMHYLRMVSFVFDIWGVYIAYKWMQKKRSFWLLLLISLINISYCYNSLIWAQVDAILGALVFASLYNMWNRKYALAAVLLALSLTFKLQGIIFIPVFGILLLLVTPVQKWLAAIARSLSVFAATIIIVAAPFMTSAAHIAQLQKVVLGLVDYNRKLTVGACNLWSLIYSWRSNYINDAEPILGTLSYKQVGLILFMLASLAAFWPLLYLVFRKLKGKTVELPLPLFMISTALVALSFYFFNTQIHERYVHPAFLFLFVYGFLRKDFFPYIVFSAAYFLNMEGLLRALHLNNYRTAIFSPYMIGGLYAVLIVYLYFRLYQHFTRLRKETDSTMLNAAT